MTGKMSSSNNFSDYIGDWVAGTVGGCVGTAAAQPFDTVKARLQTEGTAGLKLRYKSMTRCFRIIGKTEGVRGGFYKGMASPLIGQGIINFILFGVEGNVQKAYIEDRLPPTTYPVLSPFVSGSIAGISQSFVSCPMDLIKIRVQHQGIGEKREPRNLKSALFSTEDGRSQRSQKTYRGPLAMVKNIYRSEGLAGCYRGMVPTVWGDAIGFGIYFMTYENTRLLLQQSVFSGSEFFPSFIAGGLAGICTWSCSYPFDIMKARLQMDGVHAERQYKGMVDCFLKMRKEGGIRMLFKALTPTLLRAFVWSAAAFPAVEFVKLQFSMVDNSDKMHVGY